MTKNGLKATINFILGDYKKEKQIIDAVDEYTKDLLQQHPVSGSLPPSEDWISVDESLPDYDKDILVYGIPAAQNPQMGNPYKVLITRRVDNIDLRLCGVRRAFDKNNFLHTSDVTHWKPLPPKPKQ